MMISGSGSRDLAPDGNRSRRGRTARPGSPPPAPADLDAVWRALASETRRAILDALRESPLPVGDIVMRFPSLSRFAVMQHLRVLIRANLVVVKRQGRLKVNFLNPVPIHQIYERWVSRFEGAWSAMLTDLQRQAEINPPNPGPVRPRPDRV